MKVGGAAHLTVVVVGGDFGAVFGPFAFYGFCVIPLYITTTTTTAAISNVNRSYNYRNNKKNDGTTTTGCIFFFHSPHTLSASHCLGNLLPAGDSYKIHIGYPIRKVYAHVAMLRLLFSFWFCVILVDFSIYCSGCAPSLVMSKSLQ